MKTYTGKTAQEILETMTLEQKIGQLICKMFMGETEHFMEGLPGGVGELAMAAGAATASDAAAQNRAAIDAVMEKTGGIPPVLETEAISGFMGSGATSFPSAIGMAATFDPEGMRQMTNIIRRQMLSQGVRRACSPVMDIARDPRWGRTGETYGEDPTLGAAMSTAFVQGLQSDDLTRGVAACGKHFLGYAMGLAGYNSGSNHISPRELREVYAKPFQAAITEGNLQTVMNSYGAVDGSPVVGDRQVLTGLLREEMGFEGVTVSDYGAVTQLIDKRVCPDKKTAAVRALTAGMEVECPNPDCYPLLLEAVKDGSLPESVVDQAVLHILEGKIRMGLFENPYPFTELIDEEAAAAAANAEVSLKLAREAVVLLKNDGILPLSADVKKIAVIGPRADSVRILYGGYSQMAGLEMSLGNLLVEQGMGEMKEEEDYFPGSRVRRESPQLAPMIDAMTQGNIPNNLEAMVRTAPEGCEIRFAHGCDIAGTDRSGFDEAVALAKESDVVIFHCGGKYGWGEQCTSGEGRDTSTLVLPGVQEELMQALCETKTPVVVVHGDTRPINSKYAKEHASAILEQWTPGQSGGQGIADVLFGQYNPAGRLPITAVEHVGQVPMYLSEMQGDLLSLDQENVGFNSFSDALQRPLWFFGEGLSYSTFSYANGTVDAETTSDGAVTVSIDVTNDSDRDGEEVVELFIRDEAASMLRPVIELAGFCRVAICAHETRRITFTLRADQTAFINSDMQWAVESGDITVMVGSSPKDIRYTGSFRITDSAIIDPVKRGFVAKAEMKDPQ